MVIFIGESQADIAAVRRTDSAGTLDMQEKQFNRIIGISQHRRTAVYRAGIDLRTGVIRHEAAT